ncbi:MAG: anthranilate phosphoribosyltransferase [Planctomycetia bacterium]|nr:anthranilate phosphoribosyltransferase [Planctomycetia bacterium]
MGEIKDILKKTFQGEDLSENEISRMMRAIFTEEATSCQTGAFLASLATKGESPAELAAAARSMRARAKHLQILRQPIIDTCGTGGDGVGTFNISTTVAFVVAAAGGVVAKHGNRAISSKCGSADVLEYLGISTEVSHVKVEECIQKLGIGFLFAPAVHQATRVVVPIRRELGVRTIFNMLGPLTNPAGARFQVVGVYRADLTELFAEAMRLLGIQRAFIVHGHDGMDEISVSAPTRITQMENGRIRTYDLFPEMYFEQLADVEAVRGGDVQQNAEILLAVLSGECGPRRNIVLLNAAAAFVAAQMVDNLYEGIRRAQYVLDSGEAREKLEAVRAFLKG